MLLYEIVHTKQRVHSGRCTHAYITQLRIMSIQPANKAIEYLINSYNQYWIRKQKQSMLIRTARVGGRGVTLTSSRKDWAEFYGCIKQVSNDQSLQWQSLQKPHCLSVCLYVCLSVSLAVFCHNPSYVTASRCARSFRLKELTKSDCQRQVVPQKSTRE